MADELSDRIYMIAGGSNTNRRKLCRYYTVSSNSWGDCGSLQNKTIVSTDKEGIGITLILGLH